MATLDLKFYYPGNTLRSEVESTTYESILLAIKEKNSWVFVSNHLGAPLLLNLKELLAIEVIKKTFQDVRLPGTSLKEIAEVSKISYRSLFHLASKLAKVDKDASDAEKEGALVMLSPRRLEVTEHNFDLLKIPKEPRAKIKKLEKERKEADQKSQ